MINVPSDCGHNRWTTAGIWKHLMAETIVAHLPVAGLFQCVETIVALCSYWKKYGIPSISPCVCISAHCLSFCHQIVCCVYLSLSLCMPASLLISLAHLLICLTLCMSTHVFRICPSVQVSTQVSVYLLCVQPCVCKLKSVYMSMQLSSVYLSLFLVCPSMSLSAFIWVTTRPSVHYFLSIHHNQFPSVYR